MDEKFKFKTELEVRWSEIDGMNMVFNAHYLSYLDVACTAYFRDGIQLDLLKLTEEDEFNYVLAKSTMEFKSPAKVFDRLEIWCRTKEIGNTSFTIEFLINKAGENVEVLTAEIVFVCYSSEESRPKPVPSLIREKIETFEQRTANL